MKLLFLTNIPSPYRLDFFNELGKEHDLKVIFEAERNTNLNEKWYTNKIEHFEAIFLKKGNIEERKINWKVLKYINKRNQDYIIVTNYSYMTELIALLLIKIKKIPYLMEIDGALIKNESWLLKKIKMLLIKNANGYISPSGKADEFLINYGAKRNRIYRYPFTSLRENDMLSNSIETSEKNKIKEKLEIKENLMILSVARFIPEKGLEKLVEIASKVPEDVAICIVGDKPTKEYLYLVNKLNLKNIYFPGFKTKEQLKDYYKAANLFVLPTKGDVWGLVINEAMAFGLPIITTDQCGAGIELIDNNGFIIPVDDKVKLIEKINFILKDMDIQYKMSQNSLKIIKNYTIEKMAIRHTEILNNLYNKYN